MSALQKSKSLCKVNAPILSGHGATVDCECAVLEQYGCDHPRTPVSLPRLVLENAVHVVVHYLRANRPWLTLYKLQLHSPCLGGRPTGELAVIQRIVPDELMLMITGWLSPFALGAASCVCQQWIILWRNQANRKPKSMFYMHQKEGTKVASL